LEYLARNQLDQIQQATLTILQSVGVKFPSEKDLTTFADHGANADWKTQVVMLEPEMVWKALKTVPRTFVMGGRQPDLDLNLNPNLTDFTTDG